MAYADDSPPIEAIPPEDVIRNADPIGTLTPDEIRALKSRVIPQALGDIYYFDGVIKLMMDTMTEV